MLEEIAMSMSNIATTRPSMAALFRLSRCHTSADWLFFLYFFVISAVSRAGVFAFHVIIRLSSSRILGFYARIYECVQQIHYKIDDGEHQRKNEYAAKHHGIVKSLY